MSTSHAACHLNLYRILAKTDHQQRRAKATWLQHLPQKQIRQSGVVHPWWGSPHRRQRSHTLEFHRHGRRHGVAIYAGSRTVNFGD